MTTTHPPITVSVPGTCGELVQGWHPDWDVPVLVSCPIELSSRVTVSLRPDPRLIAPRSGYAKLRQAARLALTTLNCPQAGATMNVTSQLKRGRGMASSTADVVGALAGLAIALGRPFSPAQLAGLACQIEPTDSVMFAELAALAYRDGGHFEIIGPAPALPLLMLDAGGAVDTLAYNRQLNLSALRALGPTTAEALALLRQGDPAAIGAAATLSAVSYQPILFNPLLAPAQEWAAATGALGVVRAHSGSVIGLLYPPGAPLAEPARWLKKQFTGSLTQTRLTPGGVGLEQASPAAPETRPAARAPRYAAPTYQLLEPVESIV